MAVANRITEALASLKSELIELRSQDVQLMKQMIGINDTIKRMSKRKHRIQRQDSNESRDSTELTLGVVDVPFVRIQSTPDYCGMRRDSSCGSISSSDDAFSSLEDLTSCSECSEYADSDDVPTSPVFLTSAPTFSRRRSVAETNLSESPNNDAYFEDILKKNIKLWKHSKSISNESLNLAIGD